MLEIGVFPSIDLQSSFIFEKGLFGRNGGSKLASHKSELDCKLKLDSIQFKP